MSKETRGRRVKAVEDMDDVGLQLHIEGYAYRAFIFWWGAAIAAVVAVSSWYFLTTFNVSLTVTSNVVVNFGVSTLASAIVVFLCYMKKWEAFTLFFLGLGALNAILFAVSGAAFIGISPQLAVPVVFGVIALGVGFYAGTLSRKAHRLSVIDEKARYERWRPVYEDHDDAVFTLTSRCPTCGATQKGRAVGVVEA